VNNFRPLDRIADDLIAHQGRRMRATACHPYNYFDVGRVLNEKSVGPCAPRTWLGETEWTHGSLLEALKYRQRQPDGRSTITYTYVRQAPPVTMRPALVLTVEFSVYGAVSQEHLPGDINETVLGAIGHCFHLFFPLMQGLTVRPLTVMAPVNVIDQESGVATMRTPMFMMVAMDEETRDALQPRKRSRLVLPGDPDVH
jgi:hypothetical protein